MNHLRFIAAAAIALAGSISFAQTEVPKYLQVAREIVENVKPEDNLYSNYPRYIRLPGDLFSSGYTVSTDCTGFVEAVFERADRPAPQFSTKMYRNTYGIADWIGGIERGEGFTQIMRIQDLRPGDFVLWQYLPKYKETKQTIYNGHIVMVDAVPEKMEPKRPRIPGLIQWAVKTIDSNNGTVSPDDTRYVQGVSAPAANAAYEALGAPKLKMVTGIGRGTYFIYTNDDGVIQGVSLGFSKAKVHLQDEWRSLMARPM